MLNQFNEGGTHEQNPLGGIPMGQGNNGNMNTVEQGETMKDSFVYSNRIVLTPNVISQFNLPKSLTGKTVAEATKMIDKKFEGRNDKISKSTQKNLLDRAAAAQESIKAQQDELNRAQELNSLDVEDMSNGQIPQGMEEFLPQQNQMFLGGESSGDSNQLLMSGIGSVGNIGNNLIAGNKEGALDEGIKSGLGITGSLIGGPVGGMIGNTVGGLVTSFMGKKRADKAAHQAATNNARNMNSMFSEAQFAEGGNLGEPPITTKQDTMRVQKAYKDKIAQLKAQGYELKSSESGNFAKVHAENIKALNILKDAKNKNEGRQIIDDNGRLKKGVYNPDYYQRPHESGNSNLYYNMEGPTGIGIVNPNANYLLFDKRIDPNVKQEWVKKIPNPARPSGFNEDGVEVYGYDFGEKFDTPKPKSRPSTGVVRKPTTTKALGRAIQSKPKVQNLSPVAAGYTFAYGGNINRYNNGGDLLSQIDWTKVNQPYQQAPTDYMSNNFDINTKKQGDLIQNNYSTNDRLIDTNKYNLTTPQTESGNSQYPKFDWQKAGETVGQALRYAPIAMNAYQLAKLKKPGMERLDRLSNRFNPEYVDEAQLQRIANQELTNNINSLSQLGGSQGAVRNAILGAGLNKTKALSDAYMNAENQNRATNVMGQQFNLGVDTLNREVSDKEKDINQRNSAAYETEKSKLLSQIGTDLGNIGKEQTYKKMAKEMYGYTWNGKYYVNSDGSQLTAEEMKNKVDEDTKNAKAYGGFLGKSFKKRK